MRCANVTSACFTLAIGALILLAGVAEVGPMEVGAASQDNSRRDSKPTPKQARTKAPSLVAQAAPANDNCANAVSVTPANCPFTDTVDTTEATDESGEPQSTCVSQANSVWYTLHQ